VHRLWAHVVALVVVLLAAGALVLPGTSFTPDEGAYGAQADALAEGRWEYRTPADAVVPGHDHAIFEGAPYTRHPVYPWLLRASMVVTGRGPGLVALGALGTVIASAAAWWSAARLRPGAEPYAFWLTAASPLLFDGFVVWSHPLAAAAFGLALVAVARGLEGRRWSWALAAAAAVALVLLLLGY
jgi:hypothetical protein